MRNLHLPSPALAVAVIALVFAASGTGYAVSKLPKKSVGTAQLKNHAVTTRKLASSAAARIARLTYKKLAVSIPGQVMGAIDATCPSGLTALGGGLESPHAVDAPVLLDSHPTAGGWQVSVGNPATTTQPINVYAICAKAEAGTAKTAKTSTRVAHLRPF